MSLVSMPLYATIQSPPARPAVVGGCAGAILSTGDTIEQVMAVTSHDGVITSVYFVGNPDKHTSIGHPILIQ
jgi:hypothetical protein